MEVSLFDDFCSHWPDIGFCTANWGWQCTRSTFLTTLCRTNIRSIPPYKAWLSLNFIIEYQIHLNQRGSYFLNWFWQFCFRHIYSVNSALPSDISPIKSVAGVSDQSPPFFPNILCSFWGVSRDRAYRKNLAHYLFRLGPDVVFQNRRVICGKFMMQLLFLLLLPKSPFPGNICYPTKYHNKSHHCFCWLTLRS